MHRRRRDQGRQGGRHRCGGRRRRRFLDGRRSCDNLLTGTTYARKFDRVTATWRKLGKNGKNSSQVGRSLGRDIRGSVDTLPTVRMDQVVKSFAGQSIVIELASITGCGTKNMRFSGSVSVVG